MGITASSQPFDALFGAGRGNAAQAQAQWPPPASEPLVVALSAADRCDFEHGDEVLRGELSCLDGRWLGRRVCFEVALNPVGKTPDDFARVVGDPDSGLAGDSVSAYAAQLTRSLSAHRFAVTVSGDGRIARWLARDPAR